MSQKTTKIAMISGGKDSTAMAIRMCDEDWHVDEWLFCDTGKEFPAMYDHLAKLESYLGITIKRLKSERTFDYWMNEHVKTKGKRIGEVGYGWPDSRNRWCTAALKRQITNKYLKQFNDVIEYQGIAVDEAGRATKNTERTIYYPLLFWGMTEPQCLQYCYDHDFDWDGLYEDFKRVSCFCCPLSSLPELKTLYQKYPELWDEMKQMDGGKRERFKANYTLDDLEKRFDAELSQIKMFI